MDIHAKRTALKAIYDQAVAEGDVDTANEAADRAAKLLDNSPPALEKDTSLSLTNNPVAGTLEAAANLASGLVAKPISDVAGLAARTVASKNELSQDMPLKFKNYVQNLLTYAPRTSQGEAIAEYNPLALVGKGINAVAGAAGDIIEGDDKDSVARAVAANFVREAIPQGLALAGTKYTPSLIPGLKTVGKIANFVPESIANVIRPHYKAGVTKNAGMLMNKLVGDRAPAILNELDKYTTTVPSESGLSAGRAATEAGSAEFSALQEISDSLHPSEKVAAADAAELQRAQNIENVTPLIGQSKDARTARSAPHYAASDATVIPVDASLSRLMGALPKGALEEAADMSRMRGTPFQSGKYEPAKTVTNPTTGVVSTVAEQLPTMTGQALHDLKVAITDRANNPMLKGGKEGVTKGALTEFINQLETKSPEYALGRSEFSKGSVPVNQSNILRTIKNILSGQGGKERFSSFMNTMGRGEEALLKEATGYNNIGSLESILNPTQMAALNEVARQLVRDAKYKDLVTEGMSKSTGTVDKFGKPVTLPTMLMTPVTIFNSVLGKFGSAGKAKTMAEVARIMRDPAMAAKVMRAASPKERSILLKALNSKTTGVLGAENAVSQTDEPMEITINGGTAQ